MFESPTDGAVTCYNLESLRLNPEVCSPGANVGQNAEVQEIAAEGPASATEVWGRYVRPSTWPDWAPQISGVTGANDPIEPGDRGWVHGPLLTAIPFEILDIDAELQRWSWRVGIGPVSFRLDHGVEEVTDGSRAWTHVHLAAPLVWPYLPIARLALRRLVGDG